MSCSFSSKNLFNGIAVVIDDAFDYQDDLGLGQSDDIFEIVKQIEDVGIPALKIPDIPRDEEIEHFQNLSFLILDWNLTPDVASDSDESRAKRNINFIKELNKNCFCPIFIFTSEIGKADDYLRKEKILVDDKNSSNILLRKKEDVVKGKLFNVIQDWLKDNSSIYVLKEWEKEYQKAKNRLFYDFYNFSTEWASILWKSFGQEEWQKESKSLEMGEIISRNLHSRMIPFEFDEVILDQDIANQNGKDLISVLEGAKYLDEESLHSNPGVGDVFCKGNEYFLNIRAQCDLIREENPELYLIAGQEVNTNDKGHTLSEDGRVYIRMSQSRGEYDEHVYHTVVPFINKGKTVIFNFKDMKIEKWDQAGQRIGRLLPPHITRIQQRFSFYIQREGVPAIPRQVFKGDDTEPAQAKTKAEDKKED